MDMQPKNMKSGQSFTAHNFVQRKKREYLKFFCIKINSFNI